VIGSVATSPQSPYQPLTRRGAPRRPELAAAVVAHRCERRHANIPTVIVERSLHPDFLSNTYLVAEHSRDGGAAFFVDAGGPVEPLIEVAEQLAVTPTHVLLTHHHFDHVSEVGRLRERWPGLEVLIHPLERELLSGDAIGESGPVETTDAGETIRFGRLEVRPLLTPGHTAGMLSFLAIEPAVLSHAPSNGRGRQRESGEYAQAEGGEAAVFTGDTLFRDSVGGVRAPGHTTYQDLKDSIMGTLMELPPETVIYPGHADATTVAREWSENPFIRVWRGLDREGREQCRALGQPATLILLGDDYDGGYKAWVRWADGSDDIVPGSRVQR
jgi:glyoxylase-like metal-dependent hydrolase (beta-lactamase superfamily II)